MSIKHYCDACGKPLGPEAPNRAKGYVLEHVFEEELPTGEFDEDEEEIYEMRQTAVVHAKILLGVQTSKDQRMTFGDGDLCGSCCAEVLEAGIIKD